MKDETKRPKEPPTRCRTPAGGAPSLLCNIIYFATGKILEETSLQCVHLILLLIEVLAAWHFFGWFARPRCVVKGHRLVTGCLVERPILKAHIELAAVSGMWKSVMVAEPEPGVGAGELADHSGLALGPLGLGGGGAGKDGRTPDNTGAALSWGWVAVNAGCVLVALLRLLGMEVTVLSRASSRW